MTANNPGLATHHVEPASRPSAGAALFSRILASLVAGREDKGRAIADNHLSLLSDSRLLQLGYGNAGTAEIRKFGRPSVVSY